MTAPGTEEMGGGEAIIQLRDIAKSYWRERLEIPVLHGVDLDIPRGGYVALMGPSGSGKTTLLNLIAGIDRPTGGSLKVCGFELNDLDDDDLAAWRNQYVGFIFQNYNLVPVLTAFENVELPLLLSGLSRRQRRERVEQALDLVNLTDRMLNYPRQLSGGQEQRVAIARAIVTDPALLVADEPTGALDSKNAEEVLQLMERLNREMGKTIVMVTHDPKAAHHARYQIHLEKGLLDKTVEVNQAVPKPPGDATAASRGASARMGAPGDVVTSSKAQDEAERPADPVPEGWGGGLPDAASASSADDPHRPSSPSLPAGPGAPSAARAGFGKAWEA